MKTAFCVLILIFSLNLFGETIIEAGEVSGLWTANSAPYLINGDIYILDDNFLIIEGGVEIIFSANYGLSVHGQLVSEGTVVDSIFWTVSDTTGFSDLSVEAGGWGGISFDFFANQSEGSVISYNRFEYGKKIGDSEQEVTGGAICVDSCSNLVVTNSHITDCIAAHGGAIGCRNESSPEITNNIFEKCCVYRQGNINGCGGAIFCQYSSDPEISGNEISDNFAENYGGAISLFSSSNPTITENTLSGNSSTDGGAIIVGTNGSGIIAGNVFIGNTATFGGGAISFSGAESCLVENNYITGNDGNYFGGGIALFKSSSITISNNVVEYNSARRGGGISDTDEWNDNILISGNTVRYNTADFYGGGICWVCMGLELDANERNSIYMNTASIADDIYLNENFEDVYLDTFTVMIPTVVHAEPIGDFDYNIQHSVLEQVEADLYISPEGSNSNSGLTADAPLKTLDMAGRILLPGNDEYSIYISEGVYSSSSNGERFPLAGLENVHYIGAGRENTILDGEHTYLHFYFADIETAEISEMSIINSCSDDLWYWNYLSGAVNVINSTIRISNIDFCNNIASHYGGALTLSDNSVCYVEDTVLRNNSANYEGGAVFSDESTLKAQGCEFSGNSVLDSDHSSGGAIALRDSSKAVITGSTLVENSAEMGGGLLCDENSTVYIINSICRNSSNEEIYSEQEDDFADPLVIAYSNLLNGQDGITFSDEGTMFWLEGNIDEDPFFNDPDNYDYTLTENSPCIDAGTSYFSWNDEVLVEISESEYYGTAPDMGCYEFESSIILEEDLPADAPYVTNYPNPFNPQTRISYKLPGNCTNPELKIFNAKGQRVRKFKIEEGNGSIVWDGRDPNGRLVSSGVYYYRLASDNWKSEVGKMIMMK